MINKKAYELGSKRSTIRELFEYGRALRQAIGEENVCDFSLGNPSVPTPTCVSEKMKELLEVTPAEKLHGYTSAPGAPDTREAIARHIRTSFGAMASADNVYVTIGAAAALCCSLRALCNEGDEVIVLAPYFPEYKVFIESCGAVMRVVQCNAPNFHPDITAIYDAITEKTSAIIINSPNNPSGAVYTEGELLEISKVLKERSAELKKTIYIISDEPYRELVYTNTTPPYIPNLYRNTVVCYSYSKSLSLPGERIGYVFVSPQAEESAELFLAVCGAGRALGYVCAPSLLQAVIRDCVGETADIGEYRKNRDALTRALTDSGYSFASPDGAFYLFIKAPTLEGKSFFEEAKRAGILLVPSEDFGTDGYLRLAYCTDNETVNRAIPILASLAVKFGIKKDK